MWVSIDIRVRQNATHCSCEKDKDNQFKLYMYKRIIIVQKIKDSTIYCSLSRTHHCYCSFFLKKTNLCRIFLHEYSLITTHRVYILVEISLDIYLCRIAIKGGNTCLVSVRRTFGIDLHLSISLISMSNPQSFGMTESSGTSR
jgi:hypothetical protein